MSAAYAFSDISQHESVKTILDSLFAEFSRRQVTVQSLVANLPGGDRVAVGSTGDSSGPHPYIVTRENPGEGSYECYFVRDDGSVWASNQAAAPVVLPLVRSIRSKLQREDLQPTLQALNSAITKVFD